MVQQQKNIDKKLTKQQHDQSDSIETTSYQLLVDCYFVYFPQSILISIE